MTRRAFLKIVALASAGAILAACQPETAATPAATAVEAADTPVPASAEAEEIHFLCRTDIKSAYAADTAVQEWNANHDSQVTLDEPADDVATKVQAAQAAGDLVWDGYSVMEGPWSTMEWVERGIIQPLDDFVAISQIPNADQVIPNIISTIKEAASFEGKLYGIPGNCGSVGLAWMTEPLSAVGYDAQPQTWDEVYEAAKKISETAAAAVPFCAANHGLCDLVTLMWSATKDPFDEDGILDMRGEAAIKALTWMRKMAEEGLFDYGLAFGDWLKGDIAMVLSYDVAGTMNQQTFGMDAAKQGISIYPQAGVYNAGTPFWINMSVLFNHAANPSGMVDFFLWWFGPDNEATGRQIAEVAAKPCYTYTYENFIANNAEFAWEQEAIDIVAQSVWFPADRKYTTASTYLTPQIDVCMDLNQEFDPVAAMEQAYQDTVEELQKMLDA